MAHHVTRQGNRRQQTFFNDGDYSAYLELMAEWCWSSAGAHLSGRDDSLVKVAPLLAMVGERRPAKKAAKPVMCRPIWSSRSLVCTPKPSYITKHEPNWLVLKRPMTV